MDLVDQPVVTGMGSKGEIAGVRRDAEDALLRSWPHIPQVRAEPLRLRWLIFCI